MPDPTDKVKNVPATDAQPVEQSNAVIDVPEKPKGLARYTTHWLSWVVAFVVIVVIVVVVSWLLSPAVGNVFTNYICCTL